MGLSGSGSTEGRSSGVVLSFSSAIYRASAVIAIQRPVLFDCTIVLYGFAWSYTVHRILIRVATLFYSRVQKTVIEYNSSE